MKVFLATTSTGMTDATTGEILPNYQNFIKQLLTGLRKVPHAEVFCALEADNWTIGQVLPEEGVHADLQQIDAADVLFALIHDKPSAGVQFEIGYAVAKHKRVIIALAAEEPLAYFNKGIVSLSLASEITYDTIATLIQNASLALTAPADEVIT